MTAPVDISSFNALKAALARAVSPLLDAQVRGLEVRLNTTLRSVAVVLHTSTPTNSQAEAKALHAVIAECAAAIPAYAGYTFALEHAECDDALPLVYRGCPVWGRSGSRWELAADLAAAIEAGQIRPVGDPPPAA